MRTIDLEKLIQQKGIEKKELANLLFPMHKYPDLAIQRILTGEAFLDSNQISRLSTYTGLTVDELFSVSEWKMEGKPETIEFSNEEYLASLDLENWTTRIFYKKSLFHESVIHNGFTPLSEYFKSLNEIIKNHKDEQN